MNKKTSILCPAYRCKPGSMLLGVRQNNGMIAILPQALLIDDEFIKKVNHHHISPERRFRFTNKCIESGCKQWNGIGCDAAENVISFLKLVTVNNDLPSCSIRNQCRWFFQKGVDACKICHLIPTEVVIESGSIK